MFKILSGCIAATLAASLHAAPQLPAQWKALTKAQVTSENSTLRIVSPGRLGGISGTIRNIANQRITITASVRGEGQVRPGVLGSYGWAYGSTVRLNDEFQIVKVVYTDTKPAFNFTIFSLTASATNFEIKDIKAVAAPAPELTDVEIPGKLFPAADRPARHGRIEKIAGALNGKAVWGKRYYRIVNLPVPSNSRDLYYYVHLTKSSNKPMTIALKSGDQDAAKAQAAGEMKKWQWVKLGPVKAVIAYPESDLMITGDAKTTVWVDKVVLSTNDKLNDNDLDKMEE